MAIPSCLFTIFLFSIVNVTGEVSNSEKEFIQNIDSTKSLMSKAGDASKSSVNIKSPSISSLPVNGRHESDTVSESSSSSERASTAEQSSILDVVSTSFVLPESSWNTATSQMSSYSIFTPSMSHLSTSEPLKNVSSVVFTTNYSLSTEIPFSSLIANTSSALSISTLVEFNITSVYVLNVTSIEPSSMQPIVISSHHIQNASSLKPAKKDCNVVLLGLSEAMANMSRCSILNARPMHVCENCSGSLQDLRRFHKVVYKECGSELIREYNDQYQLIPKMYDFADATWQSLDCDKCYNPRNSYTDAWVLTDEFVRFKHLLAETMFCFRNHSNASLPYHDLIPFNDTMFSNSTLHGNVCTSCKYPYVELQKYFKSLNDETDISSQWCADIVYAINQTRFLWSKTFKCSQRKKDIESVVALTCFFCFLPILFYVGTKLHADVKDRKHDENDARLHYESD